jgi:hypothetical protein
VSRREPDDDIGEVMQRLAALRKRHTRCPEQPWYAALLASVAEGLGRPVAEAAADDVERFLPLLEHPNTQAAIVRDMASMELGAVLGIGFPACWHGPGRYLSHRGVRECRDRLAELSERFVIPQLAPAPVLDRLLACGVTSGLI